MVNKKLLKGIGVGVGVGFFTVPKRWRLCRAFSEAWERGGGARGEGGGGRRGGANVLHGVQQ